MYGFFEVDSDLVQIALPSVPDVPQPYGFPENVWVGRGARPFVVNTGLRGTRDALAAALEEAGIAPESVRDVVLTSTRPEAIGNIGLFPNATVHAATPSPLLVPAVAQRDERERIEKVLRDLAAGNAADPEATHADWNLDTVERFLAAYFGGQPDIVQVSPIADGTRLTLGDATVRVVVTPGVDPHACCLLDADGDRLFGGETVVRAIAPRVGSPKQYSESLDRLSPLQPKRILPAHGGVELSYFAVFRALNLSVANLVQNMPFALQGATSGARIAYNDLGFWPRDIVRFGAHVLHFQAMLDELVRSGVAASEGEGAWTVYTMDRPSRI